MIAWERWLFGVVVAAGLFLGGIIVGKYQYWPYDALDRARDAVKALWIAQVIPDRPRFHSPRRQGGVTRWEQGTAYDGLTLVAGYFADGPGAVLVTMDGSLIHRWSLSFKQAFPGATPQVLYTGPSGNVGWRGVHLYPNGDLLVNFEGSNYPPGGGLVLMDKDSRVKWALARNTHHDLEVRPDGTIVVLDQHHVDGIAGCEDLAKGPYLADELITVSPDGHVLTSFSLAQALCLSEFRSLLFPYGSTFPNARMAPDLEDFQHNNDIDVVTPEQAAVFPMANAGDYLVSFNVMNMIAVVDKETHLVKWTLAGQFIRQHDPAILPNGNLLVFDNLGGRINGREPPHGRSRILEIDPKTQAIVWQYVGGEGPLDRFDCEQGGNAQKLPNGNVLVTAAWEGRIFEVTGDANPRIVWEWVNLISATAESGRLGNMSNALRLQRSELTFLPEANGV